MWRYHHWYQDVTYAGWYKPVFLRLARLFQCFRLRRDDPHEKRDDGGQMPNRGDWLRPPRENKHPFVIFKVSDAESKSIRLQPEDKYAGYGATLSKLSHAF